MGCCVYEHGALYVTDRPTASGSLLRVECRIEDLAGREVMELVERLVEWCEARGYSLEGR